MGEIKILPLSAPVSHQLVVPGSKSYTNRSLILAALTRNPVKILNPLFSNDTEAMINCLKTLGIDVEVGPDYINVLGNVGDVRDGNYQLNAHLSGTTVRFILALSCLVPGIKIIRGESGLNKRPIQELVHGLQGLGAQIDYLDQVGFPPLKVSSTKLSSGVITLKGDISSQYFSAILMIAPQMGEVTIRVKNEQISQPYIDMTIDTMCEFGVKVINQNYKKYIVPANQRYSKREYSVEGDYSSAGYFFAMAALTKSTITVKNLNPNSKQADLRFVKILEKMGNQVTYGKNEVTIKGTAIKPIRVDMEDCPDQVQTLAVLCSFAKGVTKITGVRSLRVKETERVKALQNELKKMGIKTSSTKDSLTVYGGDPKSAHIDTYGDHRMAMSFAVAGTKLPGMVINNPQVVSKTFPQFWEKLTSIGVEIKNV